MRMKKWLQSVAMLMVLLLVAAGCSNDSSGEAGSDSGGSESATIHAIFPSGDGNDDRIKEITKQFEEANPDIKVELEFVAYNSMKQKILTSAKTGDYDVTMVDLPWLAQFASADIIQEIPGELSQEDQDDIFAPILDGVTYNEKMYAMPWKNDTKFMFYNKEMLKEAGFDTAPTTWEELKEQAEVIKEKGIVNSPIVWSWSQSEALVCDYVVLTGGSGGKIIENASPNFTDNGVKDATTFMVDTLESGLSNPNSTEYLEQDVLDSFIAGEAAFALNWSFMYSEVKNSDMADNLGIALVPGSDNVDSNTVYGGEGLGITSGSENPDEAWKYIQYLTSKEVQENNIEMTLPIWESLYLDEKVLEENPELVKMASEQFNHMISRPKIPQYGELSQTIQVEVQNILTGNKDVDTGLSDLQKQAEELLK